MTSSSSPALERGLDTMLLVYSLLQPAALACRNSSLPLFRSRSRADRVSGHDRFDGRSPLEFFFHHNVAIRGQIRQLLLYPRRPVDEKPIHLAGISQAEVHDVVEEELEG